MAEDDDVPPALAEQIHQGKRINTLDTQLQDVKKLVNTLRTGSQTTEEQLRGTISQADLRRAMGLAFQEFEMRMQEELQETHRTVLSQFCKRDEVQDIVSLVSKKVNWTDYQSLLGKVTELRTYIDHTAESIFLGQRDALQQEFARKADATSVDMALKSKADFREINDLRARVERLEMLFTGSGVHMNARFDELREDLTTGMRLSVQQIQGSLTRDREAIEKLQQIEKTSSAERENLRATIKQVGTRLEELQGSLPSTAEAMAKLEEQTATMTRLINEFREEKGATQQERLELNNQARALEHKTEEQYKELKETIKMSGEQVAFLTEASEALKRRVREVARTLTDQNKTMSLEKDGLEARLAQLVAAKAKDILPEKVAALTSRVDALAARQETVASNVATPEVPVTELLRQMVEDSLPRGDDHPPSSSGAPRLALPAPSGQRSLTPRAVTSSDRLGSYGISPRLVRPPKPR